MIQLFTEISNFTWENIIEKASLGFIEDYIYYILIFFGVFIGYLLARPITGWLVSLKSIRLLSYLMNSLFVLMILLFIIFTIDEFNHLINHVFKIYLQCLAGFGILLFLFKIFRRREKRV